MKRYYYSASIADFLSESSESILGKLATANQFPLEITQRTAWLDQISILRASLNRVQGTIYFEFSIPRMGRRADVILSIGNVLFVLEFKVGQTEFLVSDRDQVEDYALDLKNFHETSHFLTLCPLLVATDAPDQALLLPLKHPDGVFGPILCNKVTLADSIELVLLAEDSQFIDPTVWQAGRYSPTPTIIEAATALFGEHSVEEISRSDAGATNLAVTSKRVAEIIRLSRENREKSICFVTGVPGAGKTLVGLDIARQHSDQTNELYSVYLSGNGPLVAVLHEALARDRVSRAAVLGTKVKKGDALREVKAIIQNVHHFRDDCLESLQAPIEHVALFDEAQRAWGLEQTASFMKRKKNVPDFAQSEPDFLVSCLDRHEDWAVIVCLVGGGQEINTGEAGISTWIDSIAENHPGWKVYASPSLSEEYDSGRALTRLHPNNLITTEDLHLRTSMRSFRAENVSILVKHLLERDVQNARAHFDKCASKYPITLTRDLNVAKEWLKTRSRGSERTGIVVSSQAERLRPQGIHVKAPMDPVHWFLGGKDDVRSSYFLEDVATEFHVQGLEVDWACVTWDADLRMGPNGWEHWSFKGNKWQRIHKPELQKFQLNAYRVLMTRARQGMVLVVPEGDKQDHTRQPAFYDKTYDFLASLGFDQI
jgi:hypothetical protein